MKNIIVKFGFQLRKNNNTNYNLLRLLYGNISYL